MGLVDVGRHALFGDRVLLFFFKEFGCSLLLCYGFGLKLIQVGRSHQLAGKLGLLLLRVHIVKVLDGYEFLFSDLLFGAAAVVDVVADAVDGLVITLATARPLRPLRVNLC